MATASEDFNRANGAPGANWTQVNGNMAILDNALIGNDAAGDDQAYVWNANTFGTEQYSEAVITWGGATGNYYLGVICRSLTVAVTYYELVANDTESLLYRWVADVNVLLDAGDAITGTNRAVRMAATGTGATVTLTCTVDGVALGGMGTAGVVTDSNALRLLVGQIGCAGYCRPDGPTNFGIQSWSGGDISAGVSRPPLGLLMGVG